MKYCLYPGCQRSVLLLGHLIMTIILWTRRTGCICQFILPLGFWAGGLWVCTCGGEGCVWPIQAPRPCRLMIVNSKQQDPPDDAQAIQPPVFWSWPCGFRFWTPHPTCIAASGILWKLFCLFLLLGLWRVDAYSFCVPCYHVGFLHPNLRGLGKFISGHGKSSCPFPHVGMEWNSNILPMNVKLLITCPGTKREVPVPLSWPIPGEFSVAGRKDNHCPKERGG